VTYNPSQVIKVSDLVVTHNDVLVLDNVSLTVAKGEFIAIIGPNGAGKTTLVKAILGLTQPEAGSIEIFGLPISQLGAMRSKIGYVPQIFSIDLNFPITVFEAVLMGTYGRIGIGKRPSSQDRQLAMAAIEKVDLMDLKDRPIRRLSSGQRQRAFIARALANGPELLLNLYSLLRELKGEGVTVILVSHDIGVVASYVDSVACLNKTLVAHCRPGDKECAAVLKHMYGSDAAFFHHGEAPHIVVEDH